MRDFSRATYYMAETSYRRRLPQWETDRAIYFVTWRLIDGQPELSNPERDTVVSTLKFFNHTRYHLIAYVVMNDHVHVIFSIMGENPLVKIIYSRKSYTAHKLQRVHWRKSKIWQREYFDRLMTTEAQFYETLAYIEHNPFKRWPELITYPWMWMVGND